jgi:serine/threonine kinase 4
LTDENAWSLEFNDFVNKCLTLEPSERPSAEVLLQHPFIKKSKGKKFLEELVMNWIDRIEADREERALKLKQSKNDEGFFGGRRENKGIILDKVDLNYLSQEEDDSSYGKM